MPRVKVTYELTSDNKFITIESVMFDDAVTDLKKDKVVPTPPSYRSRAKSDYQVFPDNQYVKIRVIASGTNGFSWSMKVTFTILDSSESPIGDPFSPDKPIEATANKDGNASFEKSVFWKKKS